MTPKRLRLRNFLSYGEEHCELRFDQLHVACIVGKNGAGKSSLLESIAWCIWGESPRGRNRDVIRQGAEQARVEFEFEQDEKLYRIVRTARRSGNITQSVEFFYWNAEREQFMPLSGNSIRETSEKILRVVGMSYDTFINSVFLMQGRSNEFTVQSPTKRKEILAEILQIERYAKIAEDAKERRKKFEEKDVQLTSHLELLGRELEKEPKVRQDFDAAQARLSELIQQKAKLDDELAQCEKEIEELKQKEIDLATENSRLSNIETREKECQKQIEEQEQEKSILTEKLSKREQVEQDVKEYERLKAELNALEGVAEHYHRLRERLQNTQNQIQLARQKLEQEIERERQSLEMLRKEEARYQNEINRKQEAQTELAQLREKLNTLQDKIADLPKLRSNAENLAKESGTIAAKVQSCKQQMSEIEKKGKAFKELKETNCPVCHSELTPERREKVLTDYREQYRTLKTESDMLNQRAHEIELEIKDIKKAIAEREKNEKDAKEIGNKIARMTSVLENFEHSEENLRETRQTLAESEQKIKVLCEQLQSESFATELKQQETMLQNELSALGYNAEQHAALRKQLNELATAPVELEKIKTAAQNLEKCTKKIAELQDALEQLRSEKDKVQKKVEDLKNEVAALKPSENKKVALQESLNDCNKKITDKTVEVNSLQKDLNELEKRREELEQIKREKSANAEEIELYKHIEEAFGVRGIQSILIEDAVPTIEQEANRILQNLTNNHLALNIETKRQQQNEKVVESLDIYISDESGTVRDYNTFSGGEKFRVDFALRVAISKLLASQHNSGPKMLVIDEGFGSQDKDGLDAMLEAINVVKDDFEKVFIVTHLDELKEQFETKIFVSKDAASGSRFEVEFN